MKVFIMHQKNIDKMYYINLSRRDDRRLKMEKQISDIQILSKMERYDAIDWKDINFENEVLLDKLYTKKEKGYKLGISLTPGLVALHNTFAEIYKKNLFNNYGNILICEDDIVFVDDFEIKFTKALKNIPNDWDMIHFGYIKSDLIIKEKINNFYSTYEYKPGNQCFMVNKKACEVFLQYMTHPKMAVDSDMVHRIVRKGLLKGYISNERLAYQKNIRDSDTIPQDFGEFYYE